MDKIYRHIILKYYRSDLDLVLECDASKVAMNMTLMQDFSQGPRSFSIELIDVTCLEPLAFASKTQISTKQCYANIGKEMLAVIFKLEKFEYYTLDTKDLSDHKLLSSITNKEIGSAPSHLHHMLLRLERFSFAIHYTNGNNIIITDHINHNILLINGPERRETAPGLDCISIALISEELNVSQNHLDRIRCAT